MSTVSKGRRWVHVVDQWLTRAGAVTTARPWMEPGDDLHVVIGDVVLSVEGKDHRTLNLAGWVDQAGRNAPDGAVPVVIAHRLGKSQPDDAYVVMSGRAFLELVTSCRH